jgi:hypothetical protein
VAELEIYTFQGGGVYDTTGQSIVATILDDGRVTFLDRSRDIAYTTILQFRYAETPLDKEGVNILKRFVMSQYINHTYDNALCEWPDYNTKGRIALSAMLEQLGEEKLDHV